MKKILSCVLCLAMMLSMGTVAFAETSLTTDGGSHDVTVTYGMDEGFTVTIPTNFTIDESKKATADVSASNVMIAYGKVLEVAISGDDYATTGSWELVDEAETENMLTYTIGTTEGGNEITNGSIVLDVESGEAYGSTVTETMYFTVVDELAKAGTYTDTLTFTVSVEDAGVEMAILTLQILDTSVSGVYINGDEYTESTTIEVPVGTVVECMTSVESSNDRNNAYLSINGVKSYHSEGDGFYPEYVVVGNATIISGAKYGSDKYGYIEITEQ